MQCQYDDISHYYEDWHDEDNKLGLLLTDSALNHNLAYVPVDQAYEPQVDVGLHRIKPQYLVDDDIEQDHFVWKEHWRRLLSFGAVLDSFGLDQTCQLWFNECIMSQVGDRFEYDPYYRMIYKTWIGYCKWSRGCLSNYNQIVYWYNSLKRFTFPMADTEVRLDYARHFNECGRSRHANLWLDGPFGYMIYYKGQHVMRIGFAPSSIGLLLTQIQLTKKKGNRWLYQLPCHYVDFVIEAMATAFPDTRLFLTDGKSMADFVSRAYKDNVLSDDKRLHIQQCYDRDLVRFKRYESQDENQRYGNGVKFWRLYDSTGQLPLEWSDPSMQHQTVGASRTRLSA